MGEQERHLSEICAALEAQFHGIVAAFEGFVTSYLGGPRDGFPVIEVFRVPPERAEEVLGFAEPLARGYFDSYGAIISFGLWTPDETQALFVADLASIEQQRKPQWVMANLTSRDMPTKIQLSLITSCSPSHCRLFTGDCWRQFTVDPVASDGNLREAA